MKKFLSKRFRKGIKVRLFSYLLMIICSLFTIAVFGTTIKIKLMHEDLTSLMNDYTNSSLAVNDLKIASDNLTCCAISFMETCDYEYLNRYYYELNKVGRREKALNIVQLSHKDDVIDINTQLALRESNQLVKIETYAMELMCNANNKASLSGQNGKPMIILKPEDMNLPKEEKIQYARSLMFSELYLRSKDLITEYTEVAKGSLLNLYRSQEAECNKNIRKFATVQLILIIILLALFIVFYTTLVVCMFVPLRKHLLAIQNNDKMEVRGGYEVRYIATAYNAVTDKNAMDASQLKHKAEHDPLTGLINRGAFDHIISFLSSSKEPVAYLIIDIDLFKGINDRYGHIVGDKVLVKIANLLTDQFRATDYVGRIGGDEFAVIMTKFGAASVIDIIRRKIDGLNEKLQAVDNDNLPPVSLSVGVAVSDTGFKTSLIENADKALYRVKRGGRCNCFFYGAD